MTTARTKAATTSASFGTRILTQCIPGPVSGGCAESNRDARECGLKTRGLRSTLELEAGKFYRRWERLADLTAWPTLRPNRHFASLQGPPIMPADSMALASFNPSIPVCRERVVSVQLQEDPAACVFANQTKLLLSRFLAKSVAVGDESHVSDSSTRCSRLGNPRHQECHPRTGPLYLPGANRIRQPAQAGQTKSALRFG